MKRLVITGGTGFIGRHLVKRLLTNEKCSVAVISNRPNLSDRQYDGIGFLRLYTADIRDSKDISKIFQDEQADCCVHLAAKISVEDSIKKPEETMDINVKGTLNVLDACHDSRVNSFLFASSAAIYGDVTELPISESSITRPLSPYGKSKLLAEQHVMSYKQQKKIKDAISLRIFNVYGPDQTTESDVVTRFAKRLSEGLPPIIHGDGKSTRDFISVDDVAEAMLSSIRTMEERKNIDKSSSSCESIFNIGTGRATSIKKLAEKLIAISGSDLQPVFKVVKDNKKEISHSCANISKAREILHFVPKKRIDEGLKEMIEQLIRK